jgi:hypothetical protein
MQFDWRGFTEIDFVDYCSKMENNMIYEDDYLGSVRVGDLCFDLLTKFNTNNDMVLAYDLYVGGIDTGYGYSNPNKFNPEKYKEEDDYPYDYVSGLEFGDSCISMCYEKFQKFAEAEFEHFVIVENESYKLASLIEKANEELKVW